jgi:hypothetical protein
LKAKRVYLESNTALKPAIKLYEKLGFQKIAGQPTQKAIVHEGLLVGGVDVEELHVSGLPLSASGGLVSAVPPLAAAVCVGPGAPAPVGPFGVLVAGMTLLAAGATALLMGGAAAGEAAAGEAAAEPAWEQPRDAAVSGSRARCETTARMEVSG